MASVFRRPRSKFWYAAWLDAAGERQRKCTQTIDKTTAKQIAAKWESEAALRRFGVIDAAQDRYLAQEARPLADHVAEFHASLQARGNTAQHCAETRAMVERIVASCRAERIADLTASAVEQAIHKLRRIRKSKQPSEANCGKFSTVDPARPADPLSARAKNAHLRAVKSFTRWLQRDRRCRQDALLTLSALNEETDRRRTRRELSPAELAQLVEATAGFTRKEHFFRGPDRAILYRVAVATGLRASELRSLRPGSFDLMGEQPSVTVAAANSKRRREDRQPLPTGLVELLATWLADRPDDQRVFAAMPSNTARMFQADLAHARQKWIEAADGDPAERERREASEFLVYRNAAGEFIDFHSLRHSYISAIVRGGASVKVAQSLARHSTPELTIGRYSHTSAADLRSAVEGLKLPANQLPATGTDGMPVGRVGLVGVHTQCETVLFGATPCEVSTPSDPAPAVAKKVKKAQENQGLFAISAKRRARDNERAILRLSRKQFELDTLRQATAD